MKYLAIAAMPRSGSTLMAEMVGKHPAVLGFTEIFHDDETLRKACHHRTLKDEGLYAYEGGEYGRPDLYLDFLANVAMRQRQSVVSFKLMESQCPVLYGWLQARDTRLVRIVRPNLIAMAASWKMAMATNVWHITQPEERAPWATVKVRIEPAEIETWAQRERDQAELIKSTRLPYVTIGYHSILTDPEGVVESLFDLIEVTRIYPEITMLKTNERHLWDVIENFEELRDYYAGAPQEWMLDGGELAP